MTITFTKNNGELCVSIEGRLDTITAPDFESFLIKNTDGVTALTVNCEKLEYVSSAGLRVLLVAQKRMNNVMRLTNVGELVMEVFEMTGFADILTIE